MQWGIPEDHEPTRNHRTETQILRSRFILASLWFRCCVLGSVAMLDVAFWYEFRRRADVLIWLAVGNPIFLAFYILLADVSRPLDFWLIGIGITHLLCIGMAIVLFGAVQGSVHRDLDKVVREKSALDAIKRGPVMRKAAVSAHKAG
jgi:hypothetical protein